jgi:hypothetical protein
MTRSEIIRAVQDYCADIAEREQGDHPRQWTLADAEHVAELLNEDPQPWGLFRHIDEQTGASDVGYRTRDGREYFHVLRQMRNTPGSGLLETLRKREARA